MRVIAERDIETYFELRMISIPEGTELKGSLAAHLHACRAPVRVVGEQPETPEQPDGLDITGTVEEIIAWVGDDTGRATEAYEAESGKDKPRTTLLKRLEEIADN